MNCITILSVMEVGSSRRKTDDGVFMVKVTKLLSFIRMMMMKMTLS